MEEPQSLDAAWLQIAVNVPLGEGKETYGSCTSLIPVSDHKVTTSNLAVAIAYFKLKNYVEPH